MRAAFKSVFVLLVVAVALVLPASAQFGTVSNGPLTGNCASAPTFGIDNTNGRNYFCPSKHTWTANESLLADYQGTTATGITDNTMDVLTGPTTLKLPGGSANALSKHVRVRFKGVYTNGAASLLNVQIATCTVAGCATGTTVQLAGCLVTSTNQANTASNAQFWAECELTTSTTGTGGKFMAKALAGFDLGADNTAALSFFGDTVTAVTAAVDLTVDEYLTPEFKFSTSNAGNSVTVQQATLELLN